MAEKEELGGYLVKTIDLARKMTFDLCSEARFGLVRMTSTILLCWIAETRDKIESNYLVRCLKVQVRSSV
jgi:hypothetical protein